MLTVPILLVLAVTLGGSLLGVRRLRAKPTSGSGASQGTSAEVGTVALTVFAAFVTWPIGWSMLGSIRSELRGAARPDLVTFYVGVLLLPVLGGALGWRRARRRRLDGLAVWRYTVCGVLIVGLVILLVTLALVILLAYAFAHSDWEF